MKLGLELLASRAATLRLGTFFETWIATAAGTVRRSLGRDEYHLGLTIGAGKRLAATGRTHICQLDLEAAELGENQARATLASQLELTAATTVVWGIRTNLFLDLPALQAGALARLCREPGHAVEFPLNHPLIEATEVSPGRYMIDVTRLLYA